MGESESEKIKNSFLKVKQDIDSLKAQIIEFKALIEDFQKRLKSPDQTLTFSKNPSNSPQETSSIGNQGVYADIHSFIHSDIHSFNRHSTHKQTYMQTDIQPSLLEKEQKTLSWTAMDIQKVDHLFLTLTRGEFFTFMVIYQLEEDIKRGVSYLELSRHMSRSEGCIRTYLSQMLRKGVPVEKIKLNNKLTLLVINKEFRNLNLKNRLLALLSNTDPNQTTL